MPRTSRKSGAAPTPAVSAPRAPRPPSPLSPHRISRAEEQEEMRGLNNRLASYIELVQSLQRERDTLTQEISTIEESKSTEVTTIKSKYDVELNKVGYEDAGLKPALSFQSICAFFKKNTNVLYGEAHL